MLDCKSAKHAQPVCTDSIAAMPTEPIEVTRPRSARNVLGDSIPVYIVAATGKLDPFR